MTTTQIETRPIDSGALGHYRAYHRCALVASQAATSRIFEMRNTAAATLMTIDALRISITQDGAHTAALMNSLDVTKATGFTAVDTTNTVTPVAIATKTTFPAAGVATRGLTIAGVAAGMTGGTITVGEIWKSVPMFYLLAVPTTVPTNTQVMEYNPKVGDGESPFVLVQNEGLCIVNRVVFGVAGTAMVHIDVAWTETATYY